MYPSRDNDSALAPTTSDKFKNHQIHIINVNRESSKLHFALIFSAPREITAVSHDRYPALSEAVSFKVGRCFFGR